MIYNVHDLFKKIVECSTKAHLYVSTIYYELSEGYGNNNNGSNKMTST